MTAAARQSSVCSYVFASSSPVAAIDAAAGKRAASVCPVPVAIDRVADHPIGQHLPALQCQEGGNAASGVSCERMGVLAMGTGASTTRSEFEFANLGVTAMLRPARRSTTTKNAPVVRPRL